MPHSPSENSLKQTSQTLILNSGEVSPDNEYEELNFTANKEESEQSISKKMSNCLINRNYETKNENFITNRLKVESQKHRIVKNIATTRSCTHLPSRFNLLKENYKSPSILY
jgi:hypothetical protein